MALLTFLLSKASGASTGTAAALGAAAGLGTYYVTHETEWGQENLKQWDGTDFGSAPATGIIKKETPSGPGAFEVATNGVADVLKSWGGVGTAAVVATGAAATSGSISKYFPWILGGLVLYAVMK